MRPGGDSCLGWEGVVSLQLGCPVTWSRGVQWDPDQCYFLGSISPVWPGCACLNKIFRLTAIYSIVAKNTLYKVRDR